MQTFYDKRFEHISGIHNIKEIKYNGRFVLEISPIGSEHNDLLVSCPGYCSRTYRKFKTMNMSRSIKITCPLIDKPVFKCSVISSPSLFIISYSLYSTYSKASKP